MLDPTNDRETVRADWQPQALGGVTLSLAPPAHRFILRGDAAVCDVVSHALVINLPRTPLRAEQSGSSAALWLGPDEWLLINSSASTPADSFAAIHTALAGIPSSLVDISHRQLGIRVAGPNAARILNTFVPLDLALTAFPVGMVARTVFEKSEIVLWRMAEPMFHIEVWRSFAPYIGALLDTARMELAAS
jgi:sarcosine oxidase, subunit gamma